MRFSCFHYRKFRYSEDFFQADLTAVPRVLYEILIWLKLKIPSKGDFNQQLKEELYRAGKENIFSISSFSKKFISNLNKKGDYSNFIKTIKSKVEMNNPDLKILEVLNRQAARRDYPPGAKTKNDNQPHHKWLIKQIFELRKYFSGLHLFSAETSILARDKAIGTYLKGHMDLLGMVGKTIYIIDYKPELNYDLDTNLIDKHFVDSIPQVATYALAFKYMFENVLKRAGYDVKVYTFRDNAGYIYDPEVALGEFTKMYHDVTTKYPPWTWLLQHFTGDKYID